MKSNALKHKSSSKFRSVEVFTFFILLSQVSLPPLFQCLNLHFFSSFKIFSPFTFSARSKFLAQLFTVSKVCLMIKFQVCQVFRLELLQCHFKCVIKRERILFWQLFHLAFRWKRILAAIFFIVLKILFKKRDNFQ